MDDSTSDQTMSDKPEISNPSSFDFSEPTEDSSDDAYENRALPNEDVQGYDINGQPIELPPEL